MSAIRPGDAARFVEAPPERLRAVLVYGPDTGLVSERAAILAKSYVADADDPFALTRLAGEDLTGDPGRIADEVGAIGLFGGRRAIWIRPDGRDISKTLSALAGHVPAETRLVVEAGDLKKTSPLRKLFEQTEQWAALGCYADSERDLANLIEKQVAASGLVLEVEAARFLASHLGGDRLASRMEIEKLCLYCAGRQSITLEDVSAVIGDVSALESDDMVDALCLGDLARLDSLLVRQFAAGTSPVQLVSAVLRHMMLLRELQVEAGKGRPARAAVEMARPPIFFKRQENVVHALDKWPLRGIDHALDRLQEAEMVSRTGDVLARPGTAQIFLELCALAARR